MSGSGRKVLPGSPGVVGRTSRMSGIGLESLRYVREWPEGPPLSSGEVGRTSEMSRSGRKVLPEVRE